MNSSFEKDRLLKLDIYPDDSDLLITVKKALEGYTVADLKCLYTDSDSDKANYEYVLKNIESETTEKLNSAPFIILLDKIAIFGNPNSFLQQRSIVRKIK